MPRARTNHTIQAAAATPPVEASGCSFFILPPLAVLLISAVLAGLALNNPSSIQPVQSRSNLLDTPAAGAVTPNTVQSSDSTVNAAIAQAAESPALISNISPIFTREIQYWGGSISKWAASNLEYFADLYA